MKTGNTFLALTASLIAIAPITAAAYPLFYKCDANRNLSEVLTGSELDQRLKKILALPNDQRQLALLSSCEGLQDCERQLKQIADLTEIDRAITEKVFENELKKLSRSEPDAPIHALNPKVYETEKTIQSTAFQVTACRNTIEALSTAKFATSAKDGAGSIFIYYPYHSEYTYVTGCRPDKKGDLDCDPNRKAGIQTAIRNALLGGVDPYVYLALGLMEGGANGWENLGLDPIGKLKAMGCREEKSNLTDASKNKVWSYGNFHKVAPGLIRDSSLSSRLGHSMTGRGIELSAGTSYFCRSVSDQTSAILSAPDKNQCCLELAYDLNSPKLKNNPQLKNEIDHAFVAEHARQVQNQQLGGKTDPAFRLQHFNGFSRLMGGIEPVSAFRSGVNFFEEPSYGYQAMDYIINSLATNPWIRSEIQRQSKELKTNPPSILCMDVAVPGTYQIDSDSYFKKHHDTSRLKVIRGKTYAQLTQRERNVIKQELNDTPVFSRIKKQFGDVPAELKTIAEIDKQANVTTFRSKDGAGIVVTYPVGTVDGDDGSDSIQVKKIGNYQGPVPKKIQDVLSLQTDPEKAKNGFAVSVENAKASYTFFGGYTPTLQELQLDLGRGYTLPSRDEYKITFANGVTLKTRKTGKTQTSEYFDAQGKPLEHVDFESFAGQSFRVELPDGSGYSADLEELPEGVALPASTVRMAYSDGTEYSFSTETIPVEKDKNVKSSVSMEKALSYYWKEIYPSRDTISKASPLPWTKMPDSLLQQIAEKVRSESR